MKFVKKVILILTIFYGMCAPEFSVASTDYLSQIDTVMAQNSNIELELGAIQLEGSANSSATEDEAKRDINNVVRKTELKTTVLGDVLLKSKANIQQKPFLIGNLFVEFLMYPQTNGKYPVEINYGFMTPDGEFIASTAKASIDDETAKIPLSETIKNSLSSQLIQYLTPKFQSLQNSGAFIPALSEFISSNASSLLDHNVNAFPDMISKYPSVVSKIQEKVNNSRGQF